MAKYLQTKVFPRGEERQGDWIASNKWRTSLGLIIQDGAVFMCPKYAHGPGGRTCWKVTEYR